MSRAQVYELCKKCSRPSKMRVDFLGKVEIVDVVCDCKKKEKSKSGLWQFKAKPYEPSARRRRNDYY